MNEYLVPAAHAKGTKITAAVFPGPSRARTMVRQDWGRFKLDAFLPMLYHTFYEAGPEFVKQYTEEAVRTVKAPVLQRPLRRARSTPRSSRGRSRWPLAGGAAGVSIFDFGAMNAERWALLQRPSRRDAQPRRVSLQRCHRRASILAPARTRRSLASPPHPRGYVALSRHRRRLDDRRPARRRRLDAGALDRRVRRHRGRREAAPALPTRVKMLWDDTFFYVGAELEEPHVWATLTEHDSVIFHDNDFEVFIDPDGDNHEYYEFEINALSTFWDLFLPEAVQATAARR